MVNSLASQLDAWVDAVVEGRAAEPEDLVAGRSDAELEALVDAARDAVERLPTPLFEHVDTPLTRRRAALARVVAHAADRLGRAAALIDVLRSDWLRGESVVPLLHALHREGLVDEANLTARLALLSAEGGEEERIEEFLSAGGQPPDGWIEAVRDFAREPSLEAWEELFRFTPSEFYYHRLRSTLRMLRRLGVAPDMVFRLATHDAVTPDAIELVESGTVSVGTVLQRMADGAPEARPLWLGLAARAAFAQGDRFGAVRFLSEAYRIGQGDYLPIFQAMEIREEADDDLHQMLDRAGVPRFDD